MHRLSWRIIAQVASGRQRSRRCPAPPTGVARRSALNSPKPRGANSTIGNVAVYAALTGDITVAGLKFWAAHHTGSSAMLSEGVHSSVDAVTELLLLYGLRASRRPATPHHPIGFGREAFFWNLIVALTILALGAGVALYDGARQIAHPRAIEAPLVSLSVLAAAFLIDGAAIVVAIRHARSPRRSASLWSSLLETRDATLLTVLFSGVSGMLGLLLAASGVVLSDAAHSPSWDGVASVAIAAILAVTAIGLARGSKALLIGVPASPDKVRDILELAARNGSVLAANGATTIHLGPDQILVAASLAFRHDRTVADIELAVADLDRSISDTHPDVVAFLVKPESVERYAEVRRERGW